MWLPVGQQPLLVLIVLYEYYQSSSIAWAPSEHRPYLILSTLCLNGSVGECVKCSRVSALSTLLMSSGLFRKTLSVQTPFSKLEASITCFLM